MKKLLDKLSGYKTYLVVVIAVIVNGCVAQGYIDPQYLDTINTVLGFLGLGTLRHGIKK